MVQLVEIATIFLLLSSTSGKIHRPVRHLSRGFESYKALHFEGVHVPVYKLRGEDAELICKYNKGDDPLYSVQWYKDDMEFYRFMFRNIPPKKEFSVDGVEVDLNESDENRVILHNLSFASTGTYRCEVSADAPHFRTYTNQSRMAIVELPKTPPTITGAKNHYRVGEMAWLNCTSAKSHPSAKLTWFINGKEADKRNLKFYHKWIHKDGLESIQLGLAFKVREYHFFKGILILKCQATVSTIYSGTNEQDIQMVDEPYILQKKDRRISVHSDGNCIKNQSSILLLNFVVALFLIRKLQS